MEHLILTLGALVAGAAFLAITLRFAKQSAIIAYIAVGVIAGLFREQFHIPHDMIHAFTEIGIILLLFMAGLEVEFDSLKARWKLLLGNGLGQILSYILIGAAAGYLLLGIRGTAALIYFGLCLTFSSTIIVLGYLKAKKEMESLHGQIILGLMVLQDISAVLAIAVLASLGGEGSMMTSIGLIFAKMIGLGLVLFLALRPLLDRLFRYLARSQELLFVGSLGWALGVAALCELIHFSPEIGAFMAGASLSFLPYRLEIQDKVEPMKDFGVILFFIALGYGLQFDASSLTLIVPVLIVSAIVAFGTPIIMLLLGYIQRLKSRPTFMIGTIINQISEFSLILASLCLQAQIFDQRIFMLITLSTVVTIFVSSMAHQFLGALYKLFKTPLHFMDVHSKKLAMDQPEGFELEGHMVIIGYNELTERVIRHFEDKGQNVLLIDIDPEVHQKITGRFKKVACMYADAFDPDTRDDGAFHKAKAIISCLISGQEAELGILNWLKEKGLEITFIVATDSYAEALELYQHKATYVLQTEELAAERLEELLDKYGSALGGLAPLGAEHAGILRQKLDENPILLYRDA